MMRKHAVARLGNMLERLGDLLAEIKRGIHEFRQASGKSERNQKILRLQPRQPRKDLKLTLKTLLHDRRRGFSQRDHADIAIVIAPQPILQIETEVTALLIKRSDKSRIASGFLRLRRIVRVRFQKR